MEALHAVIFHKPYDINKMFDEIPNFIHKKKIPFIRETAYSYRVRNIPKTKFIKTSYRTKVINPNISLVFGQLK
jgi:hypothetical protein